MENTSWRGSSTEVVRHLFSRATQLRGPNRRRDLSEDYIFVRVGLCRAIGWQRAFDCPIVWDEQVRIDQREFWFHLPSLKLENEEMDPEYYRSCCEYRIAEGLTNMGVPESEHPSAIEKFFQVADAAVSTELPISVSVWDATVRIGGVLVPAAKSSIDALEEVRLDDGLEFESSACAICLEDFVDGRITRLPCAHYYHLHCIVQCLEINHLCPLCRYPMPTLNGPN